MKSCDVILRGGQIIDGNNKPAFSGDVAISGQHIVAVGNVDDFVAQQEIDVSGKTITPGFIDVHTHDDRALLSAPEMLAKITQGITTVITGNCGISLAPLVLDEEPPPPLNLLGDKKWFHFDTMADYFLALEQARPSVNVASLIGHSTLRVACMNDVSNKATDAEINAMQTKLTEALDAGVIGFSTGLYYATNYAADADEVIQLAKLLADYQAIYTTHIRDECDGVVDSLNEAFYIGRKANVPVVISHHKCAGANNWGRSKETLSVINAARQKQTVALDAYPYTAGSSVMNEALVDNIIEIMITWSETHPEMKGRYLADIAKQWQCTQRQAAKKLQPAGAIYFQIDEEDMRRIIKYPATMIGSDGLPHDPHPHPRLWGAFPRVIAYCCRELGLFPLENAIHKMTGLPAQQFKLMNRGVLEVGAYADITVFDAEVISDMATFDNPVMQAVGIDYVFVNGQLSWYEGKVTDNRCGQIIKHRKK